MLSVPTLWTVFVINFLALGLIWAYVMRSYTSFEAARYWTGSAFVAAAGASLTMLRMVYPESLVPLLFAGTALVLAICLAAMGIRKFYDRAVSWRDTLLITGFAFVGLAFFIFVHDSVSGRMTVFSVTQALPMLLSLKLLLSPHQGRVNPGARLAGIVIIVTLTIFATRLLGALTGGGFSYTHFSATQSVVILVLVFLSMSLNFGFLLMAMDRLRNEVANLALLDDLTGVGNRRHLVQRLTEEGARSERSSEPFALLVIDLDGFKGINDTHGHAAGARGLPGRCRAMRRQGYPDLGLDRHCAMDAGDRPLSRPADRGGRPRAVRGQAGRPRPLCRLRSRAYAGARAASAWYVRPGAAQARVKRFRAKACPALDAGWAPVRVKKTRQKQKRAIEGGHWTVIHESASVGDAIGGHRACVFRLRTNFRSRGHRARLGHA